MISVCQEFSYPPDVFVLMVCSPYKVFCQVFDNFSLIAESFKELMKAESNIMSSLPLRPKLVRFLNENMGGGCNLH
jgi:hypothetical protein